MSSARAALLAAALAVAPGSASAQVDVHGVPDETVMAMMAAVLDNLGELLCGPMRKCAPVTEFEREHPPVTFDLAHASVRQGIVSATADACGINWIVMSFKPFMQVQAARRLNERQMAIVGALHGTGMAVAKAEMEENPPSAETCERLAAEE